MGTRYSIKFVAAGADAADQRDQFQQLVDSELASLNQQMSTYIADSQLSRFNRAASHEWVKVSEEVVFVIDAALRLGEQTNGALDVTVAPLLKLWGFGPGRQEFSAAPDDEELRLAMGRVGRQFLETRSAGPPALKKTVEGLQVDLSAVAKGYAVDALAKLLDQHAITNYMIEIGGEVRCRGMRSDGKAWQIGIEQPDQSDRVVQRVVSLSNASLATSGDYRNYYELDGVRFTHVLDPARGRPVRHTLAAVTVLAADCLTADGLATALLVMGPETGYLWAEQHNVAALLLIRDGKRIRERATAKMQSYLTSRSGQ